MTTRNFWALGLLTLAAIGCGEDDKGGDDAAPGGDECPSNLSYQKTAEPFIEQYCTSCHGEGVTGAARVGAPEEHNYGTLALLQDSGHVTVERIDDADAPMPPKNAPQPSAEELEDFLTWMDCSGTSEMGGEHSHD